MCVLRSLVLLLYVARYCWGLDGIPYTWVLVASSNEEAGGGIGSSKRQATTKQVQPQVLRLPNSQVRELVRSGWHGFGVVERKTATVKDCV
jgi:hypothetical protein